jgi:hypothetical protein
MSKKKMKKHYCAACGRELVYTETVRRSGYDSNTGKPVLDTHYDWRCPKYNSWFNGVFGARHSLWWNINDPRFEHAYPDVNIYGDF